MILADTSIWVGYLRRRDVRLAARFDGLLELGEVAICGPVIGELLAGARDTEHVRGLLDGLIYRPSLASTWTQAGVLVARCRSAGRSIKLSDAMIASVAIEQSDTVWTSDIDFLTMREVVADLRVSHEPSMPR